MSSSGACTRRSITSASGAGCSACHGRPISTAIMAARVRSFSTRRRRRSPPISRPLQAHEAGRATDMAQPSTDAATAPPSFEMLKARARALVPGLRARAPRPRRCAACPTRPSPTCMRAASSACCSRSASAAASCPIARSSSLARSSPRAAARPPGCSPTSPAITGCWRCGPRQAQDEVWGASPDDLIGSALGLSRRQGHARSTAAICLSGRWPFSSGIDPSRWNFVGGIVHDENDRPVEQRCFLVQAQRLSHHRYLVRRRPARHRQQGRRDEGCLRAGASHLAALGAGRRRHRAGLRGQSRRRSTSCRCWASSPSSSAASRSASRAARSAIITQQMHARIAHLFRPPPRRSRQFAASKLGEAAALADTAEALMLKDCDEAMAITESGTQPTIEQKGALAPRRRLCRLAVHRGGQPALRRDGRRRRLSRPADPARLPRHASGQRALRAELGRQRHAMGPHRPRPARRSGDAIKLLNH